jgi:hypothetical protein
MNRSIHKFALILIVFVGTGFADLPWTTPLKGDIPEVMGQWQGLWLDAPDRHYLNRNPDLFAEVVGLGEDQYRIRFFGALFRRASAYAVIEAKAEGEKIVFDTDDWKGEISATGITGSARQSGSQEVSFRLEKMNWKSPTLEMSPPEGAIILFDGSDTLQWEMAGADGEVSWPILEDNVWEVLPRREDRTRGGSVRTREGWEDMRLHLEYRLPYLPESRGQQRANSGLFFQNSYEIQILDSFGTDGLWNEAGALYKVSPPKVNAALPPGEWQTLDVEFRAARFAEDGSVESFPMMTVLHNGIPIHNRQILKERTSHALEGRAQPPVRGSGPIFLQDHGQRIQFRNIWIIPLDQESPNMELSDFIRTD